MEGPYHASTTGGPLPTLGTDGNGELTSESDDGFGAFGVLFLCQPMAGTRIHCYPTHKTMRRVPVMLKCDMHRNTDWKQPCGGQPRNKQDMHMHMFQAAHVKAQPYVTLMIERYA